MSEIPPAVEHDPRPVVARPRSPAWRLLAGLLTVPLAAWWVFSFVHRGEGVRAPTVDTGAFAATTERIASPPPLALPPEDLIFRQPRTLPRPLPGEVVRAAPQSPAPGVPARQQSRLQRRDDEPSQIDAQSFGVPDELPRSTLAENGAPTASPPGQRNAAAADDRVLAGRLVNPSTTVLQGTVIPAVLETALDSTRPGAVRALVQRDVHSFDGTRVLIGRGSRLYGLYEEGLAPGERRALIRWTRLIRPDGVTIALDSPAADPLGRAGVSGEVDSRFLARFGGAILQSVLDLGVGLATREANGGVIVALPGSMQHVTQAQQQQVRPVLRVDHGTSVSVFVAHDLDFSSVEL